MNTIFVGSDGRTPSPHEAIAAPRLSPVTVLRMDWWQREIPLSRLRHHPRRFAPWPGSTLLCVESYLEYRVAKAFARITDCVALATQPATIYFRVEGRTRRYTPDLLVIFDSPIGPRGIVVEVKSAARVLSLAGKWRHYRAAVRQALGLPLMLVTEADLDPNGGLRA